MKKYILFISLICIPISSNAQEKDKSYEVEYIYQSYFDPNMKDAEFYNNIKSAMLDSIVYKGYLSDSVYILVVDPLDSYIELPFFKGFLELEGFYWLAFDYTSDIIYQKDDYTSVCITPEVNLYSKTQKSEIINGYRCEIWTLELGENLLISVWVTPDLPRFITPGFYNSNLPGGVVKFEFPQKGNFILTKVESNFDELENLNILCESADSTQYNFEKSMINTKWKGVTLPEK